jgi:hypothetical protein
MNTTEFDRLVAAHDFCMAKVDEQMAIMDKESQGFFTSLFRRARYVIAERLAKEYLDHGQAILDQIYEELK